MNKNNKNTTFENKKIATYICGDANIIYPSIVTFYSFSKHNNGDMYLFCDISKFNEEQMRLCKKNKINIVDTNQNFFAKRLNNFNCFLRWPKELFLSYVAPLYLYKKGYKYSIKLEYDTLCCGKYNLTEILPTSSEVICARLKRKLSVFLDDRDFNVVYECISKYTNNLNLNYRSANAGFIVFDLEQYTKENIYYIFENIYSLLCGIKLKEETIEQFCLGCLQLVIKSEFKRLPDSYIFRPFFQHYSLNTIVEYNNIHNIHYSSPYKPWLSFDEIIKRDSNFKNFQKISQIMLFNLWTKEANELGFSEEFAYRRLLYNEYAYHSMCFDFLVATKKERDEILKKIISKYESKLSKEKARRKRIKNSFSWKITYPLRMLFAFMKFIFSKPKRELQK